MYIYIYISIFTYTLQYTDILVCIRRHSIIYLLWGCLKTGDPQLQINLFKEAYFLNLKRHVVRVTEWDHGSRPSYYIQYVSSGFFVS